MSYLGIFGLEVLITIAISEIYNLEFVKHLSLTDIMNFGIGSTFPKDLGSTFSECPSQGLGALYKVCRSKE